MPRSKNARMPDSEREAGKPQTEEKTRSALQTGDAQKMEQELASRAQRLGRPLTPGEAMLSAPPGSKLRVRKT